MFEKYTEGAKRAIFFARYEASQAGAVMVDAVHLLTGLVREDSPMLEWVTGRAGVGADIRREADRFRVSDTPASTTTTMPLAPGARESLDLAARDADRLEESRIDTQHLLLGLLRSEGSVAAMIFESLGLDLESCREKLASVDLPRSGGISAEGMTEIGQTMKRDLGTRNVPAEMLRSIVAEFRRYKALGEGAMKQLSEAELHRPAPGGGNSVTAIAWHVAGNFNSRFADFLTSDGEKPDRDRESEFEKRAPSRNDLMSHWERGWRTLFDALADLKVEDLGGTVTIRGVTHTVPEALHRSLAHTSYHVGQMLYAGKAMKGADWLYLTIPPGESEVYNQNPTKEKPGGG
jgi:hypothetical protein